MNVSTPVYSHLKKYPDVYEPSEDTFLLLDALEKDGIFLKNLRPMICVEIGGGSGVVTSFLCKILGNTSVYFCTDRNPQAAKCIMETAKVNDDRNTHVVQTNLLDHLQPRLEGSVDVLVFNPPYVPTPNHEIHCTHIASSYAGGERGRLVMDKLFPLVPKILSTKGVFYLVVVKENDPVEICRLFASLGFDSETVMSRKACNEHLSVLKFTRKAELPAD